MIGFWKYLDVRHGRLENLKVPHTSPTQLHMIQDFYLAYIKIANSKFFCVIRW